MADELGVSKDLASALLIKNGWNAQAAVDALLRQDVNYILSEFKFSLEEGAKRIEENKETEEFMCPCCFCPAEPSETV